MRQYSTGCEGGLLVVSLLDSATASEVVVENKADPAPPRRSMSDMLEGQRPASKKEGNAPMDVNVLTGHVLMREEEDNDDDFSPPPRRASVAWDKTRLLLALKRRFEKAKADDVAEC